MKKSIASHLLTTLFIVATILIVNRLTHYSVDADKLAEQSIRENLLLIFCALSLSYFVTLFLLKKTK